MSPGSLHTDPFSDHAAVSEGDHETILDSTLPVGADASLTLAADGVIIAGEKGYGMLRCNMLT